MTPEQQRIAIAEACGWVESPYGKWSNDGLILRDPLNPPDYLNDLNAMHDAEKILSPTSEIEWHNQLQNVCGCSWRVMIRATAAQRAEAFLRTLGRWEEES